MNYLNTLNIIFFVFFFLLLIKLYVKLTTSICKSQVCLHGKTVIITGANNGIGYQTALDLAKRGAKVILACRDPKRGEIAAKQIIQNTDNPNIIFKKLDLSSLKSVREFSEDINKCESRLDVLVNNAGASCLPPELTEDGLLALMQTNYFGHFLLTNLLLDLMKMTPNSRIVNVSSISASIAIDFDVNHLNHFSILPWKYLSLYASSKLCNILFTIELAERLKGTSVTTYSLHPGLILTDIWKTFLPVFKEIALGILYLFYKNPLEGAQTTIYCSVAKGINHLSGQHFIECRVATRYFTARNPDLPKKLWEISENLVGLKPELMKIN